MRLGMNSGPMTQNIPHDNFRVAHLLGVLDLSFRLLRLLFHSLSHILDFLRYRARRFLEFLFSNGCSIGQCLFRLARCLFCILP